MVRSIIACAVCLTLAPLSLAGVSKQPFHSAVAADNPILWYRFSETAGTTVTNFGSLGAAFNGTLVNRVTLGTLGVVGDGAAGFNLTLQQYVESASVVPASLTGNPTFSAETIVRVAPGYTGSGFGYPPFLHWGAPAAGKSVYFSLWRFDGNRMYAGFYNGGLRMVQTVPQGCYLHVVWVRDSNDGTAGQWTGTTLYVNGEAVPLEVDPLLPGAPVINVTPTTFRVQRATDGIRYFSGNIDEVVLYGQALTAAQVSAHFAALTLPPLACRADFDSNGTVDAADLAQLLGAWEMSGAPGDCELPGNVDLSAIATSTPQISLYCWDSGGAASSSRSSELCGQSRARASRAPRTTGGVSAMNDLTGECGHLEHARSFHRGTALVPRVSDRVQPQSPEAA